MRKLIVLAALALVPLVSLRAQEAPINPPPDKVNSEKLPFDIELGTDALVFKGTNLLWIPADLSTADTGWTPYVNYDVNGQFNYDEKKDRKADLAIEAATLKIFGIRDPFDCTPGAGIRGIDLLPFAEVRGRFADIAKSDEQDWHGVLIGGAGAKVRFHSPKLMDLKGITGADVENPTLALTYYNAFVDNDEKNPASADTTIAIDQIQLAFTAEIPLAIATDQAAGRKFIEARQAYLCNPAPPIPTRPNFPYSLSISLKAGRPLKGDDRDTDLFADVALKMIQPGNKIGFVLRYRTGDDLGFEHDNQLLAGLVYRLFD